MSLSESLGFGTWQNTDPEQCKQSVECALETGYRHVDTAQRYENERFVGKGVVAASVERENIIISTKIWPGSLSYDNVHQAVRGSLNRLGIETIDLLYVHWPAKDYEPVETLRAFNELRDDGAIDAIGVSNFTRERLQEAQAVTSSPIAANQVEFHPLLQQEALREYCTAEDIILVAYSPLAQGEVFDIPEITQIAEKHDVSEAQVSLAWLQSKDGVFPIPKATTEAHIRDNFKSQTLKLDPEDVEMIESITREKRFADRDWVDW